MELFDYKKDGTQNGESQEHSPTWLSTTLLQIWGNALGVCRIGLDDDFFALGGDSIVVAHIVVAALERGIVVDPISVIESRTVRRMMIQMDQFGKNQSS